MSDLDQRLSALAADLEWPATPPLAAAARVPARAARSRWSWSGRTLLLGVLIGLGLAGGVTAAVVLRLDGATVERRSGPPPPGPPRAPLDLGRPIALADAPFTPLVPARAGAPASVHLRDGIEVALAYPPGPGRPRTATTGLGLLVTEFEGALHPAYVGKVAYAGTEVTRLRVGGERALWVEGAGHFFFYRRRGEARAEPVERELRLARNVLLVERGDLLVRLEGAFDRAEAVALARSLAPGTD